MEKHHKFSIWYILLGVWVVLLFQSYLGGVLAVKSIPYSEFLSLLKEHKIEEVAVGTNQIQGKMKVADASAKSVSFKTVRVDPEISKAGSPRRLYCKRTLP